LIPGNWFESISSRCSHADGGLPPFPLFFLSGWWYLSLPACRFSGRVPGNLSTPVFFYKLSPLLKESSSSDSGALSISSRRSLPSLWLGSQAFIFSSSSLTPVEVASSPLPLVLMSRTVISSFPFLNASFFYCSEQRPSSKGLWPRPSLPPASENFFP